MGLSELCGDACPQQLFSFPLPLTDALPDPGPGPGCPSAPVQLQSPSCSSQWAGASPPSCHGDLRLPGSCFYQLHLHPGPFVPQDCGAAAGGGSGAPCGLQVELGLSPPASPSPSCALPSHFRALGSLLHPSPVQQPRSLT